MVEDGGRQHVELITNKPLLAAFDFLLTRPFCSWCLLIHAFLLTAFLATPYSDLKRQSVELEPYNTRLKHVVHSLQHDFGDSEGRLGDSVLIWSVEKGEALLNRDPVFTALTEQLEKRLQKFKDEESDCRTLSWDSPELSPGDDAALVQLTLRQKASIGHRSECLYAIRQYLRTLDGNFGRFRLDMAGAHSVVDASYDQCDRETMHHLKLSTPFLVMLLILGVGTLPRAMTPFLCLAGSVMASRCVIVVMKGLWADLNMVGPDTQIVFVQLALCFDYSLFFWVRFSQERRQDDAAPIERILMKTLQSSGFVILVSSLVLVVAFIGASCYPDLNKLGYLYATLNLALGTLFVGFYSLTVPTVLASMMPWLFDEPSEDNYFWSAVHRTSASLKTNIFRPVGYLVTSKPWSYLMPMLVLLSFMPLIGHLMTFAPNYDVSKTDFSATVPEYAAFNLVKEKFDPPMRMTLFMETSHELQRKYMTALEKEDHEGAWNRTLKEGFRRASCMVAEAILADKTCLAMGISADKISGLWWDGFAEACADQMLDLPGDEAYVASNGTQERMFIFPELDDLLGQQAQHLIRHFWKVIEPEISLRNGKQRELFGVTLYTPVAEEMLLERQYRNLAPWILGLTMLIVCCLVAGLFKSYFVGVKMVFTVALPILAEYGIAVGVYQDGWLEWAGFESTGGLKWTMVYSTSGFLFALAMDYDLFLFSRVYELRQRGFDNASAVRLALEETGPLITLAGTIMVVSFAFVFLSSVPVIAQIGCLYCFGVALDVYVVRVWLAPAALCVWEQANYWPGEVPKPCKCYPNGALKALANDEELAYGSCK